MSASAKPTEKVFKSFLAAVLAISLCPLMPAEIAQAEEAGDSSEPTDAAQVADESLDRDADSAEGALAADGSDADSELVGENDGAEDESATDDSNVALQAASDSGAPIVDWTECGTCQWMIDSNGCLIIEPQSGETGELEDWGWTAPWSNYKNSIISVTINKTVIAKTASSAFYDCKSLRSVDLSGLDTSSVTSMYRMFEGCSSLASLDLSSLDTSKVTDMSGMFRNCPIQTLELSSFETSQVADMSSMFDGCTSLASLDISHFDTSSASNMANMFWNCSSLQSVALGDKFSFRGAKNARQCSLPKLKGDGLTGFWENVETHELYAEDEIPNNVAATYVAQMKSEVPKTSISESMFAVDTRAKTYTGSPIKPSVSSDTLNKGTDYDVSYGENVNAGEGTILITGAGSYKGQVAYSFCIDPRQVGAPEAATGLVYSGVGQVGVAPSDEYEASNGSATDAGSYTAIVSLVDKQNYEWSGSGNSDDIEVSWSIAKALLTFSMVSGVPSSMEATGSQLTPKPIVTFNGKALVQGADYSLSYGENVSPGKGTVTVTAIENSNFTGSATVEFDIEKKAEPAPEPQQFAVIYHLDGGANAADNPATYMAGTAVPLADPTKEGFEFQGWYADAEFTVRVTEISADASGDVGSRRKCWCKDRSALTLP